MSISTIKQNLVDLNAQKENVSAETKDAIERVTDDVMEVLEYFDSTLSSIKR